MRAGPARSSLPAAATAVLTLAAALVAAPAPASALAGLFGSPLTGFADLSAVQGESDGLRTGTLRQEYRLSWRRALAPYLALDAGFRYFDYEADLQQSPDIWRKEVQPNAQLSWQHPLFSFTTAGLHRTTRSTVTRGELLLDDWLFSFRTRDARYPIVSLSYDWRQARESAASGRDSRDRALQAGANYTQAQQTFSYVFTRDSNTNVVSGLESIRTSHLLRWDGTASLLDGRRLRLDTSYSLGHVSQADRAAAPQDVLEAVSAPVGLYAVDPSPGLGELAPLPGLVDGDVTRPTSPPVAIGGGEVDRNLGVDLGTRQEIAAVYVYTDLPSGDEVVWRPWISDDNLSWEPLTGSTSRFNPVQSRYEVNFPPARARYVKVVNSGLNQVLEVQVTEVRVFRPLAPGESRDRTQTEHLADLRAGYRLARGLDATVDLAWRSRSGSAEPDLRRSADWSAGLRWRQSSILVHNLRWAQSFQDLRQPGDDLREDDASYTLACDPLATVGGLLALSRRQTWFGAIRDVTIDGALVRLQGEPVYRLRATAETGWNRVDQPLAGSRLDTWSHRVGLDGPLARGLDGNLSYQVQRTRSRTGDFRRTRHVTTLGLSWRLTRTIFARADLNLVDDPGRNLNHDALLSWNLTPRFTLTAQSMLNDAAGIRTTRYGVNANLEINPRTDLYFSYARVDFTEAGGNETSSFQQGMRIGL